MSMSPAIIIGLWSKWLFFFGGSKKANLLCCSQAMSGMKPCWLLNQFQRLIDLNEPLYPHLRDVFPSEPVLHPLRGVPRINSHKEMALSDAEKSHCLLHLVLWTHSQAPSTSAMAAFCVQDRNRCLSLVSPRSAFHSRRGVRIVVWAFPPNGSLGRRSSRFCNSGECLVAKFVVQISVVLCCERSLRESPLEEFPPASLVLTIGRNPVPRVHGVIICRTGKKLEHGRRAAPKTSSRPQSDSDLYHAGAGT